jgi:hypothetical protein
MRMEFTTDATATDQFKRILGIVTQRLEKADYAGWDPFDGLNSKLFAATPLNAWPLARLAWTQAFKRMPLNLRALALVPKTANPVTIALAAEIKRRQGDVAGALALVERLLAMATVSGDAVFGWGYPFPWQAKAFYVERHEPNIIATAYALRELSHWKHVPAVQDATMRACAHIAKHFSRQVSGKGRYIAYVMQSDAVVHNANLWGAHSLALGGVMAHNSAWLEFAQDAAKFSLAAQREDGSWAYGEASHHQFTDGFHTGYVLEALQRLDQLLPGLSAKAPIHSGLDYYLSHLLEADGTAKYYAGNRYPIDANAAAQAIITFDVLQSPKNHSDLALRIMKAAIQNLWMEKRGYFSYQRTPKFTNRIEYPRWTQIWLALALQIVAGTPARK